MNQIKNAGRQHKRQYDWLKPYQWKKGQSGNLKGGPKGKTLKTFVREYFEKLSDKDKRQFLNFIDPELAWRMAEGNPHQTEEIKHDISDNLIDLIKNATDNQTGSGEVPPQSKE